MTVGKNSNKRKFSPSFSKINSMVKFLFAQVLYFYFRDLRINEKVTSSDVLCYGFVTTDEIRER